MIKTVEMDFQFSPVIPNPPRTPKQLYDQACANDEVTVNAWREQWLKQIRENHAKYGPFKDHGIGQLYGQFRHNPVIIVGSGPSLKGNVDVLKDTKGIPVISCLHNYQFLEDRGIRPDYYVSLDAGRVTVDEVSEGGTKSEDEYFASTRDKKLLAFTASHPDLIAKWKGEIYWFNAPIPDQKIMEEMATIEPFYTFVSSGGNVLGASFYIAKAILGANPIIFVGADFAFSYTRKFHAWASKYDANIGGVMLATDVFGNRVCTWQSYYNFKCWFESRCCSVPGIYINATEGGILGSYPEGNISQIRQMALSDVISMYSISEHVEEQMRNPEKDEKKILF